MVCGICKVREATVFYTEIVGGTKKEQYLCEECAAKSTSLRLKAPFGGEEFSLGGLLLGLFESSLADKEKGEGEVSQKEAGSGLSCSGCGLTYAEFKESGQFGCASCYKEFGRLLLRNMRNIQGSDAHTGKRPKNVAARQVEMAQGAAPDEAFALDETQRLTLQLEQAIEREEYELAAVLRDQIRERKRQEEKCADEKMV